MRVTYPRSHLVDSSSPGFYHIVSRCVRRSWLCGMDSETGQSYEHRRGWIERRLESLANLFAIEIYAYAVMSNHYHLVLHVDPQESKFWSDAEVAQRWIDINPPRISGEIDQRARQSEIAKVLADPIKLGLYRQRLGSLSWYMRFLNHPIACRANLEDGCKGHFWESRFKSHALLDEAAVIACMAYVDLNPVRAKIARKLSECDYTSIKRRLKSPSNDIWPFGVRYRPVSPRLDLTQHAYLLYLQKTGLLAPSRAPPDPRLQARVISMASYQRAFGSSQAIAQWISKRGQHRTRGIALP